MGWKFIFQAVVEIRTGRPLQELGGFCEIGGGRSANYQRPHVKMQSSDSLCGARHCQVQCSYSTAFQQSSP